MDGPTTGLINPFVRPDVSVADSLLCAYQSNPTYAMQCNGTQANKALVLPPPEENAIQLDLDDGGANDLMALLKERAGVDYALVPDAGVTIKAAAALAVVLALMAYLGEEQECVCEYEYPCPSLSLHPMLTLTLPQQPTHDQTVLDRWAFLASIPYNRTMWLAGSYLIFTSAVGGMVYCVIRAPLPFGLRQDEISLFAMQNSQEQFVAEGVIMGVSVRVYMGYMGLT